MKPMTFENVSIEEAKRVLDGTPKRTYRDDWTNRRAAANDDERLEPSAVAWIHALPQEIQPLMTASRYVRIANRIAALWNQPARCSAYLSDLLIIRRNARRGFPVEIAREIGNLSVHYETLHPPGRSWTVAH